MIGIDLLRVSRMERFIERFDERGLQRFLNHEEIHPGARAQSIAGLWAAKEALSKALGCGIGQELGFHDMTITKDSKGAPQVRFSPSVQSHFRIKEAAVSITHDGDYVVAAAMVVKE